LKAYLHSWHTKGRELLSKTATAAAISAGESMAEPVVEGVEETEETEEDEEEEEEGGALPPTRVGGGGGNVGARKASESIF